MRKNGAGIWAALLAGVILGGVACWAFAQEATEPLTPSDVVVTETVEVPLTPEERKKLEEAYEAAVEKVKAAEAEKAKAEETKATENAASDVPALVAKDAEGKNLPMTLAGYDVDVKVQAFAAEVAVTMTFRNETDRVLAGNLYFPLPEGVTIDGYALDIDGKLIDGVAVTKERARVVYETVVRQGIDPGLVEWSGGNSFKTRVFPIPAKGTRTIRVKYVTMLEKQAETGAAQWRLPLKFASAVENFKLRLEVIKPNAEPQVVEGALQDLAFKPWRESFVAETEQKNFLPGADLIVSLPKGDKLGEPARDVLVSAHSGVIEGKLLDSEKIYFAVRAECEKPVPVNPVILAGTFEMTTPEVLTVFWDASGSRATLDHTRSYDFLRAYLNSRFTTTVDVDLVVIRNVAEAPRRFKIDMKKDEREPQIDALINALKEIAYDGATSLGAVVLPESAANAQKEGYLASAFLFTDGISNFDALKPEKLPCALNVFATGTQIDTPRLNELAILNGGRYFNLDKTTAAQAAESLGAKTLRLSKIEGTNIIMDETYPKLTPAVTGPIMVAGRMSAPTAELVLTFSLGDEIHSVQKYELRAAPENSTLADRLYAQTKLAELAIFPDEHRDAIEALGKEFGLVTPETSLLVLDSIEQYVQYAICPPATLPELRDEYLRRMDTVEQQRVAAKENKIEQVLSMWNARLAWWNTEFKYPKDFKFGGDEDKKQEANRSSTSGFGGGDGSIAHRVPVARPDLGMSGDGALSEDAPEVVANEPAAPAAEAPAENLPAPVLATPLAPVQTPAVPVEASRESMPNVFHAPAISQPAPARASGGGAADFDGVVDLIATDGFVAGDAVVMDDDMEEVDMAFEDAGSIREFRSMGGRAYARGASDSRDADRSEAAPTASPMAGERLSREDSARQREMSENGEAAAGQEAADPLTVNGNGVVMSGRLEAVAKKSKVEQQERERKYLAAMKEAGAEKAYATYLTFRTEFATNPQFFLECSLLLESMNQHAMAVRVLSNLAELELENVPMLRILGRRLMQMDEPELAVTVFRRIKPMRAEEPHSYRDLALALIRTTEGKDAAQVPVKQALTEALELLNDVVMKPWDGRFSEIEVTALEEANVLAIPRLEAVGVKEFPIDPRLIKKMDLDFRIVMEWDADSTDIDLWVTEPSNEKVYYSHNRSTIGGYLSRDFTQGYGPEEYLLRSAMPGKYLIQAHFYGSRSVELFGSVTIQTEVYTDWGRPTQTRRTLTFQLDKGGELYTIGEVEK